MLNYNQTIEKMKEIKKEIATTKKTAKAQEDKLREISINFTETREKERIKKYNKKHQETREKVRLLQLYLQVYEQNARKIFILENIDTIIDIINRYKGKKCGPKTEEKICSEIHNKTNANAGIDEMCIYFYGIVITYKRLDIYTKCGIIDDSNVIQEMTKEMFWLPDKAEIIDNVEEYTEQKKKEFAELKARYDKLDVDIDKYNENNPFKQQNIREGINYID